MAGITPSGPFTLISSNRAGGSKCNRKSSTGARAVEPAAGSELAKIESSALAECWTAHPQRSAPPTARLTNELITAIGKLPRSNDRSLPWPFARGPEDMGQCPLAIPEFLQED